MLIDMKPKFLRFPGENYLVGPDFADAHYPTMMVTLGKKPVEISLNSVGKVKSEGTLVVIKEEKSWLLRNRSGLF